MRRPWSPSIKNDCQNRTGTLPGNEGGSEELHTAGASGRITNDQRSLLLCLTALRLMARLTLVAAYS
jgi:hypothetical protein